MRRREFIAGLGSAAGWPLVAQAQQRDRVRRVGVLAGPSGSDLELQSWLAAFRQELAQLGWVDGSTLQIDQRFGNNDLERIRVVAKELIGLQPDVILAVGTPATTALQGETRTLPVVFAPIADPVGSGFVESLARPGANLTGFGHVEGAMAGKWLQMIKEVAPHITEIAAIYNPDLAAHVKYYLGPFETIARAMALDPVITPVRSDCEIEAALEVVGRKRGGLIVLADGFLSGHRSTVIAAANHHKVPTISSDLAFAREGGLLSYGPYYLDIFRRAAGYVHRILNGEKPSDLPVQLPIRYDLIINLRAARTLDLSVPATLLVSADEVIE